MTIDAIKSQEILIIIVSVEKKNNIKTFIFAFQKEQKSK